MTQLEEDLRGARGQRRLMANSLDDVTLLVRCFTTIPRGDEWKIAAAVCNLGLMRVQNYRLSMWLIRKLRGDAGIRNFFCLLSKRVPDTVHQFVIDTADYIAHGRDREDRDSIGGWSQREIDILLSQVAFSLLADRALTPENHHAR